MTGVLPPVDSSVAAVAAVPPPKMIATPKAMAKAALAARRLCLRITASPPLASAGQSGTHDIRFERRNLLPQSRRRQRALQSPEERICREREQRDDDRGAHQTLGPVARLVEQDLAEAAAARDHCEARQRPSDVGHVDGEERATVEVAEPHAEWHRDRERDGHRGTGQQKVLPRLLQQQPPLLDDERERAFEDTESRCHAALLLANAQGVSAR